MIEWTPYDPENHPEENRRFLVVDKDHQLHTAYYYLDGRYGLRWWESRGRGYIGDVTHYAEINMPESEFFRPIGEGDSA